MTLIVELKQNADLRRFSARPALHYFMAICITTLLFNLFSGARAYGCFRSGNNADCTWAVGKLKEMGLFEVPSKTWSILQSIETVLISDPLLLPISFAIYAPIFLVALYIGRRCQLRRSYTGVVFWIFAWTLPTPVLTIFPSAIYLSWSELLWRMGLSVLHGLLCGIGYSMLAWRTRSPHPIA